MNYRLKVTSHIWNKDSNLLYDYETSDYTSQDVKLSSSGYLYKSEKVLKFVQKIDYNLNNDYVSTIAIKEDEYCIKIENELEKPEKTNNYDEKLWLVIKNTTFKEKIGYKLREGDIIKLGKVMFKVREIKSDKDQKSEYKTNIEKKMVKDKTLAEPSNFIQNNIEMNPCNVEIKKIRKIINAQCRICLMDDNEQENPLINPCSCTGSVRFIHLFCIRQWLKSKINSKSFNFLSVHTYKIFECELCKCPFTEKVKYHNEILTLVAFEKPENNYLMLESISREKRENKYVYVIHMNDKTSIKLGRSNDSDVRMTDISVSRNHAFLKLIRGDFYLEDNNSKFGSLVLVQNDIIIIPEKCLALQSGKLYLVFTILKTCFAFLKCYRNYKLSCKDYNEIFENKNPISFKTELENMVIVKTDYSMSEESEHCQVKPIRLDSIDEDKIIKIEKSICEEIEGDFKEDYSNIDNYNEVTNNNYRSMMDNSTINNGVKIPSGFKIKITGNEKMEHLESGEASNVNGSYVILPNTSVSRITNNINQEGFNLLQSVNNIINNKEDKISLLNNNNSEREMTSQRNRESNILNTKKSMESFPTVEINLSNKEIPLSSKTLIRISKNNSKLDLFDVNGNQLKSNKTHNFNNIDLDHKLIINDNKFFINENSDNKFKQIKTDKNFSFNNKFLDIYYTNNSKLRANSFDLKDISQNYNTHQQKSGKNIIHDVLISMNSEKDDKVKTEENEILPELRIESVDADKMNIKPDDVNIVNIQENDDFAQNIVKKFININNQNEHKDENEKHKADVILIEDLYVPNLEIFFDNFENKDSEDNFDQQKDNIIIFDNFENCKNNEQHEQIEQQQQRQEEQTEIKLDTYNFSKLQLNDVSLDNIKSFRDDTLIKKKLTDDSDFSYEKDKIVHKKTLK